MGHALRPSSGAEEWRHLRRYHRDSPASMSIHEEATWSTIMPTRGVFNDLIICGQHIKQPSPASLGHYRLAKRFAFAQR